MMTKVARQIEQLQKELTRTGARGMLVVAIDALSRQTLIRCSTCSTRHNTVSWTALQRLGVQHVPAGDLPEEPAFALELRNCGCGSTLAVEVA